MRRASSCSRPPSSLATTSSRSSRSSTALGSNSAISSTVDGNISNPSRLRSCPRVRPRMPSGGSSWTSSSGSLMGSASFQVGRQRAPSAEMELFSQRRKPRSTYRRPSSLGLSSSVFEANKKDVLVVGNGDRSHIVKKRPDNLKIEMIGKGMGEVSTEIREKFKNHSPTRPRIQRTSDHLRPVGGVEEGGSETRSKFAGQKAVRPVIRKIADHGHDVVPPGPLFTDSEYRKNFREAHVKGERVQPAWVTKFEKVTIDGEDTSRNQ